MANPSDVRSGFTSQSAISKLRHQCMFMFISNVYVCIIHIRVLFYEPHFLEYRGKCTSEGKTIAFVNEILLLTYYHI